MVDDGDSDPSGWVDRHGDGLYRFAMLRLGDPERAADAVQETFLHALRSRTAFAGRSSEWTWLVGILKHKIVDALRASGRRRAMIDGLSAEARARSEFDHRGRWRASPAPWPVRPGPGAEGREFWEALGACLGKLPDRLAETFLLRELDGLSSDEVQRRLAITPANLWARLHRARSLLRGCLESLERPPRTPAPSPTSPHRKARPAHGPNP